MKKTIKKITFASGREHKKKHISQDMILYLSLYGFQNIESKKMNQDYIIVENESWCQDLYLILTQKNMNQKEFDDLIMYFAHSNNINKITITYSDDTNTSYRILTIQGRPTFSIKILDDTTIELATSINKNGVNFFSVDHKELQEFRGGTNG